ncbi:MAG: hybrid sensor histidine kinase/response regulator [Gallionellaceae bacterium]|jgi:hypothetical protein
MINKQMVFLVVDDFEPMRKVTSGQLRAMGANSILMANNGAEAMRKLQNQRVDMVLSDWNMPIMSGLELLKAIRADEKLSRIPFIMITAEAERDRVEEAIFNGVNELLVKPYTTGCLAARIEKTLAAPPRAPVFGKGEFHHHPNIPTLQVVVPESAEQIRPTVLIVDDIPDNLQLLSSIFKDEYRVRIASSGEKALGICQSNDPPDLVLLDIMMPGMDGFQVAQQMREHPTSQNIPVIFITAMTGEAARIKGLELGAVDFVSKPIDPDILKPRVRNFMRYVKLHKQLQANYDGMLATARMHEDVELIMRHDMKGPLAGVIGMLQALVEESSMNDSQLKQLRVVEETALQVLNMINLSSELFKIETGRYKLDAQPVLIGDILSRIVEMARATFAEKNITIAFEVPPGKEKLQALGDAMFCYSLFQNLLRNACEAAPEKSRISVELFDESPLKIILTNKGAVPLQIRTNFFEKYITQGKQGGTGLGTYSAKLLVEAQNGKISLEVSDVHNQTTIQVSLPRFGVVK